MGEGSFPIPVTACTTEALQEALHGAVVIDNSRHLTESIVIDDQVHSIFGDTFHGFIEFRSGQTSRAATKGVVGVVGTHNQFHGAEGS